MSNEPDRQYGREFDVRQVIDKLRDDIKNDLEDSTPDQRKALFIMVRILDILNSEYGTIMRILDRQDKVNKILIGEGDNGGVKEQNDKMFAAYKSIRKMFMGLLAASLFMVVAEWYKNVKLNEIIAAQKVQANKP